MGVKVEGFKELDAALASLPESVSVRAANAAVLEAAEPVRAALEAAAPRRKGVLAASMVIRRGRSEFDATAEIGPSAFYGHFGEFGTSREPARPWARSATERAADQTFDALGTILWARVRRAWDRIVKRGVAK